MIFDESGESLDIKHDLYRSILDILVVMGDRWQCSVKHTLDVEGLGALGLRVVLGRYLDAERVDKLEQEGQLGQ